jgi:23S rRNA pseudouridine1911/1915/1917 synthase
LARFHFRASEAEAGERLDRVLAAHPAVASRALAERLIASGAALVGGEPRAKSYRLLLDDDVHVELVDEAAMQAEEIDIAVVYEDEHLLVVDKPAGIVVHPSGSTRVGTLAHGLLAFGAAGGAQDRPGIVHRLDRDTSGLLLVARSEEAHRLLQNAVRRRDVERRYLALVCGEPRSRTGRIEAPIGRDRRDRTRHSVDTETPRDAVTWFEVRELLPGRALLEVRLETGRTHQIRVHLQAIDLPVCGDPVYGVAGDLGLERQFLHAHRLRMRHPLTGAELDLTSPLPPDLDSALERARIATIPAS